MRASGVTILLWFIFNAISTNSTEFAEEWSNPTQSHLDEKSDNSQFFYWTKITHEEMWWTIFLRFLRETKFHLTPLLLRGCDKLKLCLPGESDLVLKKVRILLSGGAFGSNIWSSMLEQIIALQNLWLRPAQTNQLKNSQFSILRIASFTIWVSFPSVTVFEAL